MSVIVELQSETRWTPEKKKIAREFLFLSSITVDASKSEKKVTNRAMHQTETKTIQMLCFLMPHRRHANRRHTCAQSAALRARSQWQNNISYSRRVQPISLTNEFQLKFPTRRTSMSNRSVYNGEQMEWSRTDVQCTQRAGDYVIGQPTAKELPKHNK